LEVVLDAAVLARLDAVFPLHAAAGLRYAATVMATVDR